MKARILHSYLSARARRFTGRILTKTYIIFKPIILLRKRVKNQKPQASEIVNATLLLSEAVQQYLQLTRITVKTSFSRISRKKKPENNPFPHLFSVKSFTVPIIRLFAETRGPKFCAVLKHPEASLRNGNYHCRICQTLD